MSLALVVYLIGILPSISSSLSFLTAVSFSLLLFSPLWFIHVVNTHRNKKTEEFKEDIKTPKKYVTRVVILGLVFLFFQSLIPSEKTMYVMLAAYGVQQVVTNEKTQQILGSGVDILNLQLEKYKDELLKEKSK